MWGVDNCKNMWVSMSDGRHTDIVHVLVGNGWRSAIVHVLVGDGWRTVIVHWLVTAVSQL